MGQIESRPGPDVELPDCPGTYLLVMEVREGTLIRAGRLGELEISPGWYAYAGSAFGPGGVAARCGHHLWLSARPRWHIDYLRAVSELREIWFSCDSGKREHTWSNLIGKGKGATEPFPGFGASDCGCWSHLHRFPGAPSFRGFRERLYRLVPDHDPVRRMVVTWD
jgi:Uri superfamily endonuclease